MIKLNNKNITYVALADSNNSIKAPKEIWYADSSNSVKLVYRRKDALIEGEDYEKYHWLQGRNGAYIDTNYYPIVGTDIFSVHFRYDGTMRNPDGVEQCIFGCQDGPYGPTVIRAYINSVNNLSATYRNVSDNYFPQTGVSSNNWEITDLKLDGSNYSFIANGVTYTFSNKDVQIETMPNSIWVFKNMQTVNSNCYFHGDIAYFKITDTSSNTKMNLIPIKLLKPVPKWLDANGIRRQVGECGMIDLVSGKFYGNVNSVGTFTVENYYERKEWLIGDGTAYIDTNITFVNRIKFTADTSGTENWATITYTHSTNEYAIALIRNQIKAYYVGSSPNPLSFYVNGNRSQYTIDIDCVNGVLSVPETGQSGSKQFPTSFSYTHKFKLIQGVGLKDVFLDSMHLVPCILTMDLPASMDANNIARTKGTSGMWDLVSDRFFGNVASSGTFKAVNLAKGVDYEVYDWLVGDGSAYIKGIEYDLWNNHLQVSVGKVEYVRGQYYIKYQSDNDSRFNILFDVAENKDTFVNIFRENNGTYPHIADIQYNSMPDVIEEDFYINNSLFYCLQNGSIRTNNSSQMAIESSWTAIQPQIYSAKMSYIREVLPDSTYKSNLIPVKLLHSIPAKYDANGIARQVGECGMYDMINDVFYGNVASDGSFTVEDDN